MTTAFAYCFKCGTIGIVTNDADIPHGSLVFAHGEEEQIRTKVSARARLGYDGTLLIPGIPEALEGEEFDAFVKWHSWAFPDQGWNVHLLAEAL